MSGGSLDYFYNRLEEHIGDFNDKELDQTFDDAFKAMSQAERLRWKAKNKKQISIFDIMEE